MADEGDRLKIAVAAFVLGAGAVWAMEVRTDAKQSEIQAAQNRTVDVLIDRLDRHYEQHHEKCK